MKFILNLLILLFSIQTAFACECDNKTQLDIRDWNDTEIILTGILTKYSETKKVKNLTFSVSRIYKGKILTKNISFQVLKDEDHEALHHVEKIQLGQKWILFASKSIKNKNIFYQLNEESEDGFCMLSKPIKEQDPYLNFIKKTLKKPFLREHAFYKNQKIFAKGSIQNLEAIGLWKYYISKTNYWEGNYSNGKRNGKWIHKAVNFKNEGVTIGVETYKNGELTERIQYNYVGQKKLQEIYNKTTKTRIFYQGRYISAKWIVDRIQKTTLVENYKNGKLFDSIKQNKELF